MNEQRGDGRKKGTLVDLTSCLDGPSFLSSLYLSLTKGLRTWAEISSFFPVRKRNNNKKGGGTD